MADQHILPKKVPAKPVSQTPYADIARGETIQNARATHNPLSVQDMRTTTAATQAVRELVRADGISSTALFSFVEIANSGGKLAAYDNITHDYSPEGTLLLRSIYAQMGVLWDYTVGYGDKVDPVSLTDTMLQEVVSTGAVACELVMNKERLPDRVQVVPYETLEWVSRGDGTKYPQQLVAGGDPVPLNIPSFFVGELHKPADATYNLSMFTPALEEGYHYREFVEDIRRVVRKTGHSRTTVYLDAEKVVASADSATRADRKKLDTYLESVRTQVETVVSSLEPEDALVTYDTARVEHSQTRGEKSDYKELLDAISGIAATSLKTHPSVLGMRLAGSQGLSNTESLVYMKIARALQKPVESVWSRLLTMACRLYGANIYAKYEFNPINLRPEDELSAYRTMEQARILEKLSLGFVSMDEAAYLLNCGPVPAGAQDLSGTMFTLGSGSGLADQVTPNTGAQEQVLSPSTPTKAGGRSQ